MAGHVFVVQGRFEALVRDAVVVTTDARLTLEPHWLPVLGGEEPAALRPHGWGEDGRLHGRARGRDDLWFLNVTDITSTAQLLAAVRDVLTEVAASGVAVSAGRSLPLVAVPVPGIGGGGFREQAGSVIAGLLGVLREAVAEHPLDVVVVATTEAQYAAIQRERRADRRWDLDPALLARAEQIGEVAAQGGLALFLGAGVSVPAGLPSWSELVEEMRRLAVEKGADLPADEFAVLDVLDRTELLAGVLGDRLQSQVAERFRSARPALSHVLLANLRCLEAVTTNYDDCYETAVSAQERGAEVTVMPWEPPRPGRPWLLKLHGDARRPDSVVLTRGQFIGYDAQWRPVGSVFQALLMTRRLLVVGASLSDDNVLRLAHEVRALRRRHDIDSPLGDVVTLGMPPLRARLWEGQLDCVPLPGESGEERARQLEIFLDAVAAHATRASPYLLHPWYADLLESDGEAALARRATELAADIRSALRSGTLAQDSGWTGLLDALERRGAADTPT